MAVDGETKRGLDSGLFHLHTRDHLGEVSEQNDTVKCKQYC